MKLVLPDFPRLCFVDVVGGGDEAEDTTSADEDGSGVVGDGDADEKLGRNRVIVPEDGIRDFISTFLLGGMVRAGFTTRTARYSSFKIHC
jgi:hypothetical protein